MYGTLQTQQLITWSDTLIKTFQIRVITPLCKKHYDRMFGTSQVMGYVLTNQNRGFFEDIFSSHSSLSTKYFPNYLDGLWPKYGPRTICWDTHWGMINFRRHLVILIYFSYLVLIHCAQINGSFKRLKLNLANYVYLMKEIG